MPAATAQKPAQNPTPPPRPTLSIAPPPKPEDEKHANILLYGPQKQGKTGAAASAPPRILYLNCEQPNALHYARSRFGQNLDEVKVEGLKTLMDVTNYVKAGITKGDLEYETLVCDPMHDLYRILRDDLSNHATRAAVQLIGDAQVHMERFARSMCELPINTVWVAHDTETKNEADGTVTTIPYLGTNNDKPAGKLMGMVDVIAYCRAIKEEGSDDLSYVAQLVDANGRRGGDRFDVLGKLRTLDLSEWISLITESNEAPKQVQKGEGQ